VAGSNTDKGERLNLPEQTVAELLNGKVDYLEIEQLHAIARKAGISPKLSRSP
jgi:hypothetical protein